MELQELSWLLLVSLFLASLLIVLGWLFQFSLTVARLWRARRRSSLLLLSQPCRSLAGGLRGLVLRLRSTMGRVKGPSLEAGVKGLLTSLFSFKSFRDHWHQTWVSALNEQACRHGSSIQIRFDSSVQLTAASSLESVTCTDRAANRMVLHCKCCVDSLKFPVTVTQQSHAVVSIDTYHITTAPVLAKVVVRLEEVEDEGLLVSWTLSKQPSLVVSVCPTKAPTGPEAELADLPVIKALVEDTLFSTHPAMVLNLKSSSASTPVDLLSAPPSARVRRLLLQQLRVTFSKGQGGRSGELCCVFSLDHPPTEKTTRFLSPPTPPDAALQWSEDVHLELSPTTKELRVRLLERNGNREQFLPGRASLGLDGESKVPTGRHVFTISPGQGSAPTATLTAELFYSDGQESHGVLGVGALRSSLTPTKKVDVDRTIMADGTIVTTITTVQSRLKLHRSPGHSPLQSPCKVEVTEKMAAVLSDGRGSAPNPSNAAIRQLTEAASKAARKTPTKRSTLIISGVSKVPLSDDGAALSSGYAAAMDTAVSANHFGVGLHQDVDETTPSDVSERPSVDDVESDTGSTGGYETRSLKDHKVSFLQSGTKSFFHRRRRQKEPCLSQSHEDVSNMADSFTPGGGAGGSINRKKSGSFSRRLIKRFSFRSSGKSKGKAANGGTPSLDK